MYIVYVHACLISGKSYVGWSGLRKPDIKNNFRSLPDIDLDVYFMTRRWYEHVRDANGTKTNRAFLNAIRKYGTTDSWIHDVLYVCETRIAAKDAEVELIASLETMSPDGYNETRGGDGVIDMSSDLVERHRVATRIAMARPDVREKYLIAINDPEIKKRHKENVSAAMKRPDAIANMSAAQKIAQNRPEVKAHACIVQSIAQNRPETRAKKSRAIKAALSTPEAKARCIAAQNDPAVRERIRITFKETVKTSEKFAKRRKPIQQIDLDTDEVIATFSSAHEASRVTGTNRGNMCACARKNANGMVHKTAGFRWRYV